MSNSVVKRSNGHLGPVLVEESERHAETDDDGDDHSVRRITGQSGDGGAEEEKQDEGVGTSIPRIVEHTDTVGPDYAVTYARQAIGNDGFRQSVVSAVELSENLVRGYSSSRH